MRSTVPILAAVMAMSACERAPPEPRVTVGDAVVVLPVLPGRPGVAYFVLRSNRDGIRLTGVTSPRVGRIELHETMTENGVARMRPLANPTLGAGEPLSFAAGGRHAMLFEIDPGVRAGATIPLIFSFDPAPAVTVEARVRPFGADNGGH